MDVFSFVLEQALKQLNVPSSAIEQFHIVRNLSAVDEKGFPSELFELSAPMVIRGLLNFAILQMKRDWVYPHWVHKQLDPSSSSFIPRSQNPLFLNTTHRNWTLLGSPYGKHEAIVDPHGLLTPLPREWSIDVWFSTRGTVYFPSLASPPLQYYDPQAPFLTTIFSNDSLECAVDAFTDNIRRQQDVVFQCLRVSHRYSAPLPVVIGIAIRPFNPEGVAPIYHIELHPNKRFVFVNHRIGIVFSETPSEFYCSDGKTEDTAAFFRRYATNTISSHTLPARENKSRVICDMGLANAVAFFPLVIPPNREKKICWSVALGTEEDLKNVPVKSTWRVSFESRRAQHRERWQEEREKGATITIGNYTLQTLLDVNCLALLQLHDGDTITPGPFLYHRFWIRDAVPMTYALERLGFQTRTRHIIDELPKYLRSDGFFQAPEGEWDSNGAVLWLLEQHYRYTYRISWLRHMFPMVKRAVNWIITKRRERKDSRSTHRGLMPPSLSAEHFGTVDQYYWDSFWSYAGIRSAVYLATVTNNKSEAESWRKELSSFAQDLQRSLNRVAERLQTPLIPATPSRPFDESAIGFVCALYPLQISNLFSSAFSTTLDTFVARYVTPEGFYHPIIHSGYNAYLTLQLAHAYLLMNVASKAWSLAETIFQHCTSPYSLPEALHPRTKGGSMGDGHHGWASAEIVLFLLDCLVQEQETSLLVFPASPEKLFQWGTDVKIKNLPTRFGTFSFSLTFHSKDNALCELVLLPFEDHLPSWIDIFLPFPIRRLLATSGGEKHQYTSASSYTKIRLFSSEAKFFLER
jgi:hypothetical protein